MSVAQQSLPWLEFSRTPNGRRFMEFHHRHPVVYRVMVAEARRYRRHRDRWSMKALYEVMRWQRVLAGLPDEDEDFKLNNSYTAFYARLILAQEPDLAGFFETRTQREGE